jgi:hypothetical protein
MPWPDRRLLSTEHDHAVPVEDHEDLLLERMAMRRRGVLAGEHLHVLDPGGDRAGRAAEVAPDPGHARSLDPHRLDVLYIDDRGWPWAGRVRERWGSQLGLADVLDREPVDEPWQRLDCARADERQAQSREAHALVLVALAEGQDGEGLEGVQGVGAGAREIDDAVAGADLGYLARLPRQPSPAQHVEDLLVAAVLVRRRRPSSGRQIDPADADLCAAGGRAHHRPTAAQMAQLDLAYPRVVVVSDPHERGL